MSVERHTVPGAVPWLQLGKTGLALLAGAIIGFLLMTRGCASTAQAGGVAQERYAVVLSTLFVEGESLKSVVGYLPPLGAPDASGYFVRLADRYAKSSDRKRQRQAEDLRRLADALAKGVPEEETSGIAPPATTVAEQQRPAVTAPTTPAVAPAMGVVKSEGEGVRLRAEPNTTSPALGLLANGARVEILNVVDGQSVAGSEKRWYKVRSGDKLGYVYFLYLAPTD